MVPSEVAEMSRDLEAAGLDERTAMNLARKFYKAHVEPRHAE